MFLLCPVWKPWGRGSWISDFVTDWQTGSLTVMLKKNTNDKSSQKTYLTKIDVGIDNLRHQLIFDVTWVIYCSSSVSRWHSWLSYQHDTHIYSFQIYVLEDSVRNRSPVFLRDHWRKRKTEASEKFALSRKTQYRSTCRSGKNGVYSHKCSIFDFYQSCMRISS